MSQNRVEQQNTGKVEAAAAKTEVRKWDKNRVISHQRELLTRSAEAQAYVPAGTTPVPGYYLGVKQNQDGSLVYSVLCSAMTAIRECRPRTMTAEEAEKRYQLAYWLVMEKNLTIPTAFGWAWSEPADAVMAADSMHELAQQIAARPAKIRDESATGKLADFAEWLVERVKSGDNRSAAELAAEYARLQREARASQK